MLKKKNRKIEERLEFDVHENYELGWRLERHIESCS